MTLFCFRKSLGMQIVFLFFLLPVSCVTGIDPGMPGDKTPAPVHIRPISGQIVHLPEKGPLNLTVTEAGLMALENNRSLRVERMNSSIQKTVEDQERAVFDPVLRAGGSVLTDDNKTLNSSGRYDESWVLDTVQGHMALKEFFPTGTFVTVEAIAKTTDAARYRDPYASTRLGLTITQSLLQGYGTDVNLARIRQAQIETDITRYEFQGFSEALVAQVETTYWDYALSLRQIEIVEESLRLARRQITETQEMIKVGTMAESELAAVQAEAAAQQQGLIDAKSSLAANRLRLLRLLNPPGEAFWEREITLVHPPTLPEIKDDDIGVHTALAIRMRPEMNQARLELQKNKIEIVRTRNGLLPRMDFFVTLGKTGYADAFTGSVKDIPTDSYDMKAGVNFEYPVFNRNARARQRRAILNRDKAGMALDNLEQIIELDVRSAYIERNRTKEQIAASMATRKFQEEKLRIETEKFRVGRSTNLLVAQAQRDLLESRINEVRAVVNYLKAIVEFYRREGSLLERRGIRVLDHSPLG